ncbi:hypothetical protein A3D77_04480 [Candidatus Gottesmanbacteria bacterium RIFCSPHIGHO2_02_FULL_39_11]|uniref:Serine aminopeptidase S33 domain-containing protein n=1 Tax=Candidatus Gottesmanbacteria bacterium RIFCSPHIGHO2_02_FULL_39_11 TaxID=1798382 RepID=A0A1F5ZJB0_9BACT|nr:MAG: hypothetical protein A3D77_04480 [Candidatus Gottesmanbacteria bacterium RIFCSPHIGHO2_02_FULL_39_11]
MKVLILLASIISLLLFSLFFYIWYRLRVKLHLHAASDKRPLPAGWTANTFFITNRDGGKIAYWYFPVTGPKAIVILIHGYSNPGGKAQMLGHAEYLRNAGYSTVLLDLRSYGESKGNKITLGVAEWKDVEAVFDHIKSLSENKGKKIGFLGISMGGTTALTTAGETGKGDFVIASVPYANFSSLFHFQIKAAGLSPTIFYPFMKIAAFIELGRDYERFSPSTVIKNIKSPILLISAKQDEELNWKDAKNLYELANSPKEYWEADSLHDVFSAHPAEFKQHVLSFLQKYAF